MPLGRPQRAVIRGGIVLGVIYVLYRLAYFATPGGDLKFGGHGHRGSPPEDDGIPPLSLKRVLSEDKLKKDAIVNAFQYAWSAYERDAFGSDEYHPLTKKGENFTRSGGIGYMIIDSLDTMMLMGLEPEVKRARNWISRDLSFNHQGNYNTFETTIRVLGGLLSAYHLSGGDEVYLAKATDLADKLLAAFSTPSGLPMAMVDLGKGVGVPDGTGMISTAEAATLQLEMKYLSHISDDSTYWKRSEKVLELIKRNVKGGLVPIYMNPTTGDFVQSEIRLGSRGDSYYEYLLKQYIQTGRTEKIYREMYDEAMDGIHDKLVHRTRFHNLVYTAELEPVGRTYQQKMSAAGQWTLSHKQDHLVCFLGGSLLLGAVDFDYKGARPTERQKRDRGTGEELIRTCMETHRTATGLSPEIAMFYAPEQFDEAVKAGRAWYIKGEKDRYPLLDERYILRPETVESLFIAYRLTGDEKYRTWGWEIFEAIEKHCKVQTGGYASVKGVNRLPVELDDKMETFYLAETLKYLFLLFSNSSVLPLSDVVFNTEAHPLPVFHPSIRTGFS